AVIEARGVGKRYGATWVLRDLRFRAAPGEVLLLLGDNGAGKTTLLRAILGITEYEGSIEVDGLEALSHGREVRRRIGYMPQSGGLHLDLSVAETVRFYAGLRGVPGEIARERLRSVGLEERETARVGELSIGMRQRLVFAVATLSDPPILLLDEPTASLDAGSRALLVERLRELAGRGKTVVLSTHSERDLAGIATRAVRLEEGRLAA
ncbi:MAG TPA: ABC transporter ATP-binding protein, partial [Thermoanaerobaculia bacterium]|nr:ABC transporter ATP-binding protein [Thermoanaerobaculia bacterium]